MRQLLQQEETGRHDVNERPSAVGCTYFCSLDALVGCSTPAGYSTWACKDDYNFVNQL